MEASGIGTGLPSSFHKDIALSRVINSIDLVKLFAAIDADSQLIGAGVVYIDGDLNVVELRQFVPICRRKPIHVVLKESPRQMPVEMFARELRTKPRESRLVAELLGAGLSCTGAVLGWTVVFGAGIMVPLSAGTSTLVVTVGVSAAAASSIQCFNNLMRASAEVVDPSFNDVLDSQSWYTNTAAALDFVSLAGAGSSGLVTARFVLLTKRATGKPTLDVLKGLNRNERSRLTKELARVQHPGVSNAMVKAMQRSGDLPKRLSHAQVKSATLTQIRDALGGTLGFLGSASSGLVKSIAVGVYGELIE